MLVDSHVHVWRALPETAAAAPTIVSGRSDVPAALLAEYLSEHGVNRAVLVQPLYPGEDNDYVAGCAAADPARYAAVCVVNPAAPGAAERLAHWATARGCRGVRLRPRLPQEAAVFGQPASYALWDTARDLGLVVQVLLGPEHLPALAAMAERYADVPVVIDHLGHPDPAAGPQAPGFQSLLALARFPRVVVKLSGYYYFSAAPYPYADCHDLIKAVYDCFGPNRLLWGSDFPHVLLKTGYGRSMRFPRRVLTYLSADDLECIMGRNAAQIYWPDG